MENTIIAIDFDGTIVEHCFPEIGNAVPFAFDVMKAMQSAGCKLILFTMRSDLVSDGISDEGHAADRLFLTEAIEFCRANGIGFWGINKNPEQHSWTLSPKPYAHMYIDDAAFGCPLIENEVGKRPFVNWLAIQELLLVK
jgi:hypothetical protein